MVLESGYHDGASIWSLQDLLSPAAGPPVFPGLAATNQVIAYYRPGTLDYTANPPEINTKSSPAHMPRTAAGVVTDLHTALANAGVPAPYVLVAHSLGGLFSRLYAQSHPGQVAGLVLVDSFATSIPALMGTQWPAYRRLLNRPASAGHTARLGGDRHRHQRGRACRRPAAASRDAASGAIEDRAVPGPARGESLLAGPAPESLEPDASELPALEPGTPHMIATGSDHYIQVREPGLVIAATRLVIGRTRSK